MSQEIYCGECGELVWIMTHCHIAKHGLTFEEYLKKHPHHAYLWIWPDVAGEQSYAKFARLQKKLGVKPHKSRGLLHDNRR